MEKIKISKTHSFCFCVLFYQVLKTKCIVNANWFQLSLRAQIGNFDYFLYGAVNYDYFLNALHSETNDRDIFTHCINYKAPASETHCCKQKNLEVYKCWLYSRSLFFLISYWKTCISNEFQSIAMQAMFIQWQIQSQRMNGWNDIPTTIVCKNSSLYSLTHLNCI